MTDEQIKQKAEDYINENTQGVVIDVNIRNFLLDVYLAGAHSRDEEIGRMNTTIRLYANQIAQQRKEIEQLRNPWISVEERPKKTDVYYVRTRQGCADMAYFDSSIKKWEKGRFTDGTVTHLMPIPQIKKGE